MHLARLARTISLSGSLLPQTPYPTQSMAITERGWQENRGDPKITRASPYKASRGQGGCLLSPYHARTLEFTLYMPRTVKSLRPAGRMHYLSVKVIDTKLNSGLFDGNISMPGSCI